MTWQAALCLILLWIWRRIVEPGLPNLNPVEIIEAAKSVKIAADKWAAVGDAFVSWHLPAAIVLGVIIGVAFMLLRGKTS